MKKYFFEPWVGGNYASKGFAGKKILALGDSHYCKHRDNGCTAECGNLNASCLEVKETGEFTTNVINHFLEYKRWKNVEHEPWMNSYTKFANLFIANKDNAEEIIAFWESILFYNFIQRAMSKGDGRPEEPSGQDYVNGKAPFLKLLAEYQPDLIVVWSERLWTNIAKYGTSGETPVLDGQKGKLCYFKAGDKEFPAWHIYSPSATSFSYDNEKPYIQEVLNSLKA